MLTKTDLSKIRKVVREEVEIEAKSTKRDLRSEIKLARIELQTRVDQVSDEVKDFKIEQLEQGKDIKFIKSDIREIKKDLKTTIEFFDKEVLGLSKRVKEIEQHPHLSTN